MLCDTNPGSPPPHLLDALRAPRRPRLDDPQAREMFRRWRRLGRPIVVAELRELIDCLVPQPAYPSMDTGHPGGRRDRRVCHP